MSDLTAPGRKRTFGRQVFAFALLAGMVGAGAPAPGALLPLSFEELTHKSKHVITGKVVRMRSYHETVEPLGDMIFTDVTIEVRSQILGTFEKKEITLKVPGGVVGALRQLWPEAARFREGELVLVFVCEVKNRLMITGWKQGKYRLSSDGGSVLGGGGLPIGRRTPLSTVRSQVQLFAATRPPPPSATQAGASATEDER